MTTETPTKKPGLYAIHADLQALESILDDTGGELTDDAEAQIRAWFAECEGKLADKADAYAQLIRVLDLKASIAKEEAERLTALSVERRKAADNLKDRLKGVMQMHGLKKLESERFKFTVAQNGGLLPIEVVDPSKLPSEFHRVRIEADGVAIRNAIAAGTVPAGVVVKERGTHLRIT
jgi:hypothetical protein